MAKLPRMYIDSKLFPRGRLKDGIKKTGLPDEAKEDLHPDPHGIEEATKGTREAIAVLKAEPDTTGKLEGKFKVGVGEMINQLNKIVDAEYSQWLRYYHYALVLRGHCRDALAAEFEGHAEEELAHAERIAMRVVALGGYPSTVVNPPAPHRDAEEILKELLLREQEGMALYRGVLALCGENEGTRQVLEGNIEQEQEHVDDLWRFLKNPELIKAGADQESAGRTTMPDEDQAKNDWERDLKRYPRGVGAANTPDLPERGKDWHGTSTPDDPSDDVEEDEDVVLGGHKSLSDLGKSVAYAQQAFAGAPRFTSGPIVPPREREFLMRFGYSPEEIDTGQVNVTPRIRAEFNRYITGVVQKSISDLDSRRG